MNVSGFWLEAGLAARAEGELEYMMSNGSEPLICAEVKAWTSRVDLVAVVGCSRWCSSGGSSAQRMHENDSAAAPS